VVTAYLGNPDYRDENLLGQMEGRFAGLSLPNVGMEFFFSWLQA
jgi:hypothetical protein